MRTRGCVRWSLLALAVALLGPPQTVVAQLTPPVLGTVVGEATALRVTIAGTTTTLAATGRLVDDKDARSADALSGSIASVGGAQVLSATTISSVWGWDAADYVSSAASLANLGVTIAGSQVQAAFVMAEAVAPVGAVATGWSTVEGLSVNGVPIALTGTIGETILLPGLKIVVNELRSSAGGTTVNALRISSLDGLVDVIVASATAGIR